MTHCMNILHVKSLKRCRTSQRVFVLLNPKDTVSYPRWFVITAAGVTERSRDGMAMEALAPNGTPRSTTTMTTPITAADHRPDTRHHHHQLCLRRLDTRAGPTDPPHPHLPCPGLLHPPLDGTIQAMNDMVAPRRSPLHRPYRGLLGSEDSAGASPPTPIHPPHQRGEAGDAEEVAEGPTRLRHIVRIHHRTFVRTDAACHRPRSWPLRPSLLEVWLGLGLGLEPRL